MPRSKGNAHIRSEDGSPHSPQRYLRAVYEIEEAGESPTQVRLVAILNRRAPTIHTALGRLAAQGLILTGPLMLTDEGRHQARQSVRRTRLAHRMLVDILGMSAEDARPEAERIGDVMTAPAERALFRRLGYPTVGPTGSPIPGSDNVDDAAPSVSEPDEPIVAHSDEALLFGTW